MARTIVMPMLLRHGNTVIVPFQEFHRLLEISPEKRCFLRPWISCRLRGPLLVGGSAWFPDQYRETVLEI